MSENTAYNENELLARLAKDDQDAFAVLLDAYRNKVFSHAMTYVKSYEEAEELVQDIFMKVWINRHRLVQVTQFKNYLFILARNQLISSIRKKVMATTDSDQTNIREDLMIPDKQYDFKETYNVILQGIERLSPQQKAVFTLSRIDHLTHEEISNQLGISKRTVKFHLVLALNAMREFLHDIGETVTVLFLCCLLPFLRR